MDLKEELENKLLRLERQINQEKEELKKSLDVVNIMEYTNINSNRLVFLQGKKESILDILDMIKFHSRKYDMEDGYNLVEFTNVKSEDQIVKNVDYTVIQHLGNSIEENEVFDICNKLSLTDSILMIVNVKNGEVVYCENMVFFIETGWFLDCCEHQFRVYASVAFDTDLV